MAAAGRYGRFASGPNVEASSRLNRTFPIYQIYCPNSPNHAFYHVHESVEFVNMAGLHAIRGVISSLDDTSHRRSLVFLPSRRRSEYRCRGLDDLHMRLETPFEFVTRRLDRCQPWRTM